MLKSAKLIKNAPECPYVRLIGIRSVLANFRTHVIRCSLDSNGLVVRVLEYFRNSKVTELDCVVPGEKNIRRFNVSVKNFFAMDIL